MHRLQLPGSPIAFVFTQKRQTKNSSLLTVHCYWKCTPKHQQTGAFDDQIAVRVEVILGVKKSAKTMQKQRWLNVRQIGRCFFVARSQGEAIFNQKLLEVVKQFWSPYPPKKLIYRISRGIQILWLWDISQKKNKRQSNTVIVITVTYLTSANQL